MWPTTIQFDYQCNMILISKYIRDLFLISSQKVFKISSELCHAEFLEPWIQMFNFKCVKLLYPV